MARPKMYLVLVSTNLVYIPNEGGGSSGLGGRVCLDGAGSSEGEKLREPMGFCGKITWMSRWKLVNS